MNKADYEAKYREWWLNKYCRQMGSKGEFRLVVAIEVYGPPSFVYGAATLKFEDDTEMTVPKGGRRFRPAKKEIEVRTTAP